MQIRKLSFIILFTGIAFVSVIPHLIPDFWLTDIFSHFKLQYIILLFFLLPVSFFFFKRNAIPPLLVLILLVWNSWFILPLYQENFSEGDMAGETLSILSMNLLASNTNYPEVLELIKEKDSDVVILLELSPQWEEQLQSIYPQYPFRQMIPQLNNFGIGVLSKIPMSSSVTGLGSRFPPSILSDFILNGEEISILATHPVPPVSQEKFNLRNDQLQQIAELSKFQNGNFIVAGDLNTSSYSNHFRELMKTGNLKDSRKGFGILSSWPTDIYLMRTTLDHFLIRGNFKVVKRTTERNIGSDPLPTYLEVEY